MALDKIMKAVKRHEEEMSNRDCQTIFLKNIKDETVMELKRFDTNTWILNPRDKNEQIVKIVLEDRSEM